MPSAKYTPAQRAHILDVYRAHGRAEASRRLADEGLHITPGVIGSMASRANVHRAATKNLEAAVATNRLTIEQRKQNLAAGLMDDIERLRAQLFAPAEVFNFGGKDNTFARETINEPTFGDKKACITSIAIGVDKIQLLTGGATVRTELTGDRDAMLARASALDELADRRLARHAQTG